MCAMTWIGCVRLVRYLKCEKIVGACKMSAIKLSVRHLSTERKCSRYVIILIWLSPNYLLCRLINIHKPGWQAMKCVLYFSIIPMIFDSYESSRVAHHSEFSRFWMTDGWNECITCVAFSWTVFSKLVFLSFQFRFPWGLAISNSNSQTEREPYLQFWILHFPNLM